MSPELLSLCQYELLTDSELQRRRAFPDPRYDNSQIDGESPRSGYRNGALNVKCTALACRSPLIELEGVLQCHVVLKGTMFSAVAPCYRCQG